MLLHPNYPQLTENVPVENLDEIESIDLNEINKQERGRSKTPKKKNSFRTKKTKNI